MRDPRKIGDGLSLDVRLRFAPAAAPGGRYHLLYDYLQNRYADVVVLTFQQIEDLVGFTLPDSARRDADWWRVDGHVAAEAGDAWSLASRSARANLRAETVTFARIG